MNDEEKITIYQVGDSIRDQIMGTMSDNVEYAVEAESYETMKKYLIDEEFDILLEEPHFLTIRAKFPNSHEVANFSLCRTDHQYNTMQIGNILDDLACRDFTINAIARDKDGNHIDPYNGIRDIRKRILRCVGSAEERIREDPLRALRAVRFIVTKGFKPDDELLKVLQSSWIVELLKTLPTERVRQELDRTFSKDNVGTSDFLYNLESFIEAVE